MGGAELRAMLDTLPEVICRDLSVSYSPCLGMCDKEGKPPYIELNGKIIGGVSKTNLLNILKEAVKDAV
jgi:NADH:ubiquinone oxidoreductase subunit E